MLLVVALAVVTSCTQDRDIVSVKHVSFDASFDSGRSGFLEQLPGDEGFDSCWDGGEELLVIPDAGSSTTAVVSSEGLFDVVVDSSVRSVSIYSPSSAWSSGYATPVIPAVQTPRRYSVDPAAHIACSRDMSISDNSVNRVYMEHQVAYAKMKVNTPSNFVIDYVVIHLRGYDDDEFKDVTYSVNADNVDDNIFWFASEAMDVTSFSVTAYSASGLSFSKSINLVDIGKDLMLVRGKVSNFSVSNLESDSVDPAEPGTAANPYAFTLKEMSEKNYIYYIFETEAFQFRLDTCWKKNTKEGNYIFDEKDISYKYSMVYVGIHEYKVTPDSGYARFKQQGDLWRIDLHVVYEKGEFYAFYEGPLLR